jgi:GNAT superfamily N-acetyltransferase
MNQENQGSPDLLDPSAIGEQDQSVTMVRAGKNDLEIVRDIHRQAMRPSLEKALGSWNDEAQGAWLGRHIGLAKTWLVVKNDKMVGSVSLHSREDDEYLELLQILPEEQGHGLGGIVLGEICRKADERNRPLRLATLVGAAAERLYTRAGFTVEGHSGEYRLFVRAPRVPSRGTPDTPRRRAGR